MGVALFWTTPIGNWLEYGIWVAATGPSAAFAGEIAANVEQARVDGIVAAVAEGGDEGGIIRRVRRDAVNPDQFGTQLIDQTGARVGQFGRAQDSVRDCLAR